MNRIKQFVSIILVVILLFLSIPFNVRAGTEANADGGSNAGAGGGGGGNADPYTVSVKKQGYRFTFVDTDTGEKVSNTVDILRSPKPETPLLYQTSAAENYKLLIDDNTAGMYRQVLYTEIASQLQWIAGDTYEEMPWWMITEHISDSVSLKNWLLSDAALANLSGITDTLLSANTKSENYRSGVEQSPIITGNYVGEQITKATEELRGIELKNQEIINYVYLCVDSMDGILEDLRTDKGIRQDTLDLTYMQSLVNAFRDELDEKYSQTGPANTQIELSNAKNTNEILSNLKKKTDGMVAEAVEGADAGGAISVNGEEIVNPNAGKSGAAIWQNHKEQMVGRTFNAQLYGYVIPLINCEDTAHNPLFTAGTKMTVDELGIAFLENRVSLIVEPILWCCPRDYTTGTNYVYQVYGTPRNWAYAQAAIDPVWTMSDSGLDNFRTINGIFFTAMYLQGDEFSIASSQNRAPVGGEANFYTAGVGTWYVNHTKTGDVKMYSFSGFRGYLESGRVGIGMHIYGCKAAQSDRLIIDIPTDGEPGLPPWTSTVENPIKVIKFYQTRLAPDIVIPESYHVVPNAPRKIQISDSEKGWKYIAYFTSTTDYQIPPNGDFGEYTWERSYKEAADGTYGGTSTGTLTIKDTDPDKTVFILYERYPDVVTKESDPIHTYNIKDNPDYDDYSEPSDGLKDSSTYGDKKNHFSLDKHYRYRDSITNEVTEISYYTTINAPHTVIIQDEREQTGFALKDWFTSTDDWLPPDGGTPSDYNWESVVKGQHKNGKYEGTGETTLTVQPEDPDNVLHLLYEFEGKPFINIVKIYKNEDGSVNHTKGPEPHEDLKKYKVEEDEEGFSYVETLVSTQEPDPGNPNGTSTKSKEINIPEGTKTLYIIYQAKGKQIILYSNELTYTYDLRDLVKERVLFGIYDQAPNPPYSEPYCSRHGKHNRKCRNYPKRLDDSSFGMTVVDNFDYNNETTFILDYIQTNKGGASFSRTWTAKKSGTTTPNSTDRVKPNYDYVLYRQKDKDLVTLYPKKNDGLSGELSRLGINITAYTPAGSRAEKEMTKDKYFENHLQTHFIYATHDTSLTWNWSNRRCDTHHTGTYTTKSVATPQGANDFYSKNPSNVKEYYFVGQSNEGLDTNISDTRPGDDSFVSKYKRNQAYATVSAELSFYPYAKMFYRAKDANDNLQDVFVTSENLSKMSVFNAMQVGIYKKNEINANLTSTQWSTHARSLTFLEKTGVSDKKSVLPGGAIQDIDMGNQGDTQLGLRLWQTCLPDGQVEAVQEGFKVSETEARSATDALMESIKTAIGGYGLVQWGTEGVQTDFRSVLSGTELHENTSVPFVLGNSGTTAADDKYYLRHDGSGSSRANFDCLDARIERQNLYTIYSDTDGNVWVTKDGAELGRISITESAETLINKSKELQLLDANTKLITNYVSALDRNKGDKSKYDRYDKNKYNEAFDGVSVLLTDMSFDIGFGQGMAKRTNVLDPLLVAQAESKSDLYNFDDANKVRSSVYVTTTTSTAAEKQQEGYFGTLKAVSGIGDLEIGISDIQSMVYTKNFYIPNATVSDLN